MQRKRQIYLPCHVSCTWDTGSDDYRNWSRGAWGWCRGYGPSYPWASSSFASASFLSTFADRRLQNSSLINVLFSQHTLIARRNYISSRRRNATKILGSLARINSSATADKLHVRNRKADCAFKRQDTFRPFVHDDGSDFPRDVRAEVSGLVVEYGRDAREESWLQVENVNNFSARKTGKFLRREIRVFNVETDLEAGRSGKK